jgi:hypothetical protein
MACLRLGASLLAGALAAPAMPVSPPPQVSRLLKVLTADRNFPVRSAPGLGIAIVYQSRVPASREEARAVAAAFALAGTRAEGPLRVTLVDVTDPSRLAPAVAAAAPDVLWVAPLEDFDVSRIAALARAGRIRTATGVPAYVDAGIAVGFEPAPDGVRILVNLAAARAEGADFSASLLKLARLVP